MMLRYQSDEVSQGSAACRLALCSTTSPPTHSTKNNAMIEKTECQPWQSAVYILREFRDARDRTNRRRTLESVATDGSDGSRCRCGVCSAARTGVLFCTFVADGRVDRQENWSSFGKRLTPPAVPGRSFPVRPSPVQRESKAPTTDISVGFA